MLFLDMLNHIVVTLIVAAAFSLYVLLTKGEPTKNLEQGELFYKD